VVTYPDVVISRSTQYRLTATSDGTYDGASSAPVTIVALRAVGLGSRAPSVLVRHAIAIGGLVSPASPGTSVMLQRRFGDIWSTRATTLITAASRYSFIIRPRVRGTLIYRTVTMAEANYGRSTSRVYTLKVLGLRTVVINSTVRSTVVGRSFAIHGAVQPATPGTRVILQRKFGSRWRTRAAMPASSASRYRFAVLPRSRGKLIYRTVVSGDRNYAMSISRTATVIVR
jgi:hypothetical protein